MTEAKNKPEGGASDSGRTITGTRLANASSPPGAVHGATPPPGSAGPAASAVPESLDGTHLRVVTVAPGNQSFPDIEAPSRDRRDPYVGSIIDGRYKVETVLGEGGMGVVYRCVHTIIGKRLALKVLRSDLARDAEVTERFLNEAKSASAIGNPHIIDISDFGQFSNGSAYFVMEFLTGRALNPLDADGQQMSIDRVLKVARQLGEGLAAAHAAGIVHRDLKPDNIFLIQRGAEKDFVKILDFGIAKVSTSEGKLTRAGAVFGTPHYMSPEQAAGTSVDHRGDIYSVGVILYELVSGRVPFDADNFMGVLTQHMYKAPLPLREVTARPELLPDGLESIVMKCLAKRPEQRYGSMQEFVADIDKLSAGLRPVAARDRSEDLMEPGAYYDDDAAPPPARGKARLLWVLAAVVVAVGAGALAVARRPHARVPAAPHATIAAEVPKTTELQRAPTPRTAPGPVIKTAMIATEPVAAEIFRGSESLGKSPVSVSVLEGQTVELSLKAEGFKDVAIVVDGSKPSQSIKLEPLPQKLKQPKTPTLAPARTTTKPAPKRSTLGGSEIVDPWGK